MGADFPAALGEWPSEKAVDALREVFVELRSRHPRSHFNGLHVNRLHGTHADLPGSPLGP